MPSNNVLIAVATQHKLNKSSNLYNTVLFFQKRGNGEGRMYKPKQVGILLVGSALQKKCRASLPLPRGSFFKRENNNNVVIISTYIALYIFKALCKHQLMGHSRISSV